MRPSGTVVSMKRKLLMFGSAAVIGVGLVGVAPSEAASGKYAFMMRMPDSKDPIRWNPCETITWRWSSGNAKQRSLMAGAFRQLSKATGITFRQIRSGTPAIDVRYRPLPGSTVGFAQVSSQSYFIDDTNYAIVYNKAEIKIDTDLKKSKFSNAFRAEVYLHEAGHALGLGHVNSRKEIMNPMVHGQTKLGAGDKAGLKKLGRSAGCIAPPSQEFRSLPATVSIAD